MKRMICLFLTGLMLLSAACSALPTQQGEGSTDQTGTEQQANPNEPGSELTHVGVVDPIRPVTEPLEVVPDVQGYDGFAALLSAAILSGTHNQNLSPISVYLALAMVAEGANGNTQAELLKLMGCRTIAELRGICAKMLETLTVDEEGSTLDFHNSLWMASEIEGQPVSFHTNYLDTLADAYRSEAYAVAFGTKSASQQIADWINKHTRGKIDVQADALNFDPATLAVLINTIYLKDGWTEAFEEKQTEVGTFYGRDSIFDVSYMRRLDKNAVVRQGDGWLAYRVYLNRVGYVTFVLPDEGVALDSLLGSPEAIEKLLNKGIDGNFDVSLWIPKFKFQDKMELTEVLAALGLQESFSPNADFSGISDTPCRIDSVIQESYIGVDEVGVEATAYTMIMMKATGYLMPVEREQIDFHLTRPFFYTIQANDGTVLFIGTVTEPTVAK